MVLLCFKVVTIFIGLIPLMQGFYLLNDNVDESVGVISEEEPIQDDGFVTDDSITGEPETSYSPVITTSTPAPPEPTSSNPDTAESTTVTPEPVQPTTVPVVEVTTQPEKITTSTPQETTVQPETTTTTQPETTTTPKPETTTTQPPETTTTTMQPEATTTTPQPETTTTTPQPETTTTTTQPETTTTQPETTTGARVADTTTTSKIPETTSTPKPPEPTTTSLPETTTTQKPPEPTTTVVPETTTTQKPPEPTTTQKPPEPTTTTSKLPETTPMLSTEDDGFTDEGTTADFITGDRITTLEPEITTEKWPTEEEGTVVVRIFNISDAEFNETETQDRFTTILAKYITEYCQIEDSGCPNNDTINGTDVVISDIETELLEDIQEGDILWDYLDQFDPDTNLLVSLYVQRPDYEPGALLTREVLQDAITMYADDIAAEFGYAIEVKAPEPTEAPPSGPLTDWQIALIAVGGALVVTTVIAVPVAVTKKKSRNKLATQKFSINGRDLIFAGPDQSMKDLSMADILADGPPEVISDSAKLVGSGVFTHNSFFDNPNFQGDPVLLGESKTAM